MLVKRIAIIAVTALPVTLIGGPSRAAEAEPAVAASAWYWERQMSQEVSDPTSGADIAVIELPNPWCPGTPISTPEQTCHDGRLPIEVVNGDYETPDKISAVGFDLALVPIGSDISKFIATFREAPGENEPPSMNHTDKELQACVITDFFGDGYAREYNEAPKFECSDTDPRAKRKKFKGGGGGGDDDAFAWTFDLTEIAQRWMEEGSAVTAIMLMPAPPKDKQDPASADPDDNWRVVLAGPMVENGVITSLVYKPPPVAPIGTTAGGSSSGTFGGSTTGGFGTSGGFGTTTTDPGTGLDTGDAIGTDPSPAPAETPIAAAPTAEEQQTPGLPGYFWLALLTGLVGASLLKSVVLERATGNRPGGVLAQIREINAARRPAAGLAAAAGGAGAARSPSFGAGLKSLPSRLSFLRRR